MLAFSEAIEIRWFDHDTSPRLDVICLIVAFMLHIPFAFMTFKVKGRGLHRSVTERLVSVDLIDMEQLKKPAPPPPPVVKKESLISRLKALVKKEPPKPVPQPKSKLEPKKLDIQPKQIKLDPKKLDAPEMKKIESKSGFKTKAKADLVKDQIKLNKGGAGVTPLSAKKLGIDPNRQQYKSSKSGFQVAKTEKLSGIGGGGPAIAGAGGPTIAIQTGNTATKEKFSAARVQKKDKGRIGDVSAPNLGDSTLGLRDKIIARDAEPSKIGGSGSSAHQMARASGSGVSATKKDAGRFQGGSYSGSPGAGSQAGKTQATKKIAVAPIKPKKKVKKKMVTITGPLKDRKRLKEVIPEYPFWAQQQGIEATVVLSFAVTRDGIVKEAIEIVRTSAYPKLDEEAKRALRQWKWVPLPEDVYRDEVGTITFNFQLE
jgi:TonB family protein